MRGPKFEFGRFSSGRERKKILLEHAISVDQLKEDSDDIVRLESHYNYTALNSPLDSSHDKSEYNYEREVSFYRTFRKILPEGVTSLRQYIEEVLADKKGRAVGMEFGGIGVNAFSGFTRGFFKRSFGIVLGDHREGVMKEADRELLVDLKHEVLEGDILSPGPYKILENKLGGDKVDLIMERMILGLEMVPPDPYTIGKVLQTWYQLLNEGGIMLVQVPTVFEELLVRWETLLSSQYKDVLEFQFSRDIGSVSGSNCAFRLRKLPGAPASLPLLDLETLRNTPSKLQVKSRSQT